MDCPKSQISDLATFSHYCVKMLIKQCFLMLIIHCFFDKNVTSNSFGDLSISYKIETNIILYCIKKST